MANLLDSFENDKKLWEKEKELLLRFQKLKDEPLEKLSGFQTPNLQYQKSEVPSSWKLDTYVQTPVEQAK